MINVWQIYTKMVVKPVKLVIILCIFVKLMLYYSNISKNQAWVIKENIP